MEDLYCLNFFLNSYQLALPTKLLLFNAAGPVCVAFALSCLRAIYELPTAWTFGEQKHILPLISHRTRKVSSVCSY